MKMSKHFHIEEMECKCEGCGHSYPMDNRFMSNLDELRENLDCAVFVTSGFRCLAHNEAVGGVTSSWHTKGKAADVYCKYATLEEIAEQAEDLFEEVIVYDTFVHVANAEGPV